MYYRILNAKKNMLIGQVYESFDKADDDATKLCASDGSEYHVLRLVSTHKLVKKFIQEYH